MCDDLPPHLTPEEIRQYARESETILEFSHACRIGRNPAKQLLSRYDLRDEVKTGGDLISSET